MSPADDFIIVRKRKKYKFARFTELPNCFEAKEFQADERNSFTRNQPVTLELGAGTGHFSVEMARRHPAQKFVAVDVKADRLYQGARVAHEAKLTNIYFVRAHADQLLQFLPAHSVNELWLTFPDPYPKKRAAKHRMTHPHFLAIFQQLVAPGGTFHFKTDNLELFHWSLEQMVAKKLPLGFLTFDLHASQASEDYKIQTTYEQRYLGEGKSINAVDIRF